MNRICVIGDSHAAALKLGWAAIEPDFPETQIDFYAAPGQYMADLVVAHGKLVADSAVLRERLERNSAPAPDIAPDYDGYILCALLGTPRRAAGLWNGFRSERQTKDNRAPISDACYEAAMAGVVGALLLFQTLHKLRNITDSPVTVLATPMLGEQRRENAWARMHATGDDAIVADFFNEACARIADASHAHFLPQPEETLASPLHTRKIYAENPARLWIDGPDDGAHMNALYGAVVLRLALARLAR